MHACLRPALNPMLFALLILCFPAAPALADAPFEAYHIPFSAALKPALRATIGLLMIGPGDRHEPAAQPFDLPILSKRGGAYASAGSLELFSGAVPLTSYGYGQPADRARVGREMGLATCRFPVTEWNEKYAEILVDPLRGTRAWVCPAALGRDFTVNYVPVAGLAQGGFTAIDIFGFTGSGNRKVYAAPDRKAASRVVSKDEPMYKDHLLVAVEVKGEFLKVEVRSTDDGSSFKTLESFWVRLRDDDGMLMVWPVDADLC